MADNVTFQNDDLATAPDATVVSTEEVTTLNGGSVTAQHVQRVVLALRTADGTAIDLPGDSSNGIDVDVTRISGAISLPTGAATEATLATRLTESDFDTKAGALTETAPATDTASSGLNGRLQRIAQRLTSLISLLPASLGQKLMAASLPVVLASDQAAIPVTVTSTTITGTVDTELTTADLDTGAGTDTRAVIGLAYGASGGGVLVSTTNPLPIGDNGGSITVDAASLPLPSGASTAANQSTIIGHLDGVEGLLTTIDADTGTIAGAVAGTEMQVDIVGALPAGANNIGDVDIASIAAGDNNIGNVDIVSLPNEGQQTMANSISVAVASDQTTLPVSAASLPLPSGAATSANQTTEIARLDTLITQTDGVETSLSSIDTKLSSQATAANQASEQTLMGAVTETAPATDTASSGLNGRLQRIAQRLTSLIALIPAALTGSGNFKVAIVESTVTQPVSGTVAATQSGTWNIGTVTAVTAISNALPAGTNAIGKLAANDGVDIGDVTINNAAGASAVNIQDGGNTITVDGTVTANAGTGTFATKETRAATSAVTSVNDTASNTTLLASNANRLGATIYNDSTVNLYLKLGATASATSFTVLMIPGAYYEIPFFYTGVIDGIWASDASGAARITEATA